MIYFDNSSTTKPYKEVVDSFVTVSTKYFGNPSSLHGLGATSENLLSQARKQAAGLLQVKEQEIYFTSGGTEGNNIAIKGVAMAFQSRGKHIITSAIEHASVLEPCKQLESFDFDVTYVPVDAEGRVSAEDVIQAVRPDTILVSIMQVNNEIGTIQPIEEIGAFLKKKDKIFFHVDYVQGINKVDLRIKESGIDLCSLSAHKFHGLKGTGLLYVRDGIRLSPLFSGGNQERRLRSGTENVAGAVSCAKALRMSFEAMQQNDGRLAQIQAFLRSELKKIDGVVINSPENHCAPHILNFSVPKVKSEVLVHALEDRQIYVSTTSACSSKQKSFSDTILMMTDDEERAISSIRISLSYENTMEEAKQFTAGLKAVLENLKEVMR